MYIMICPKCGRVRKQYNRDNTCSFCDTTLVQTNYLEDDYYELDGKGSVHESLKRKYVRKSPLYSEAAEKASIRASNAEYLANLRKRQAAASQPTPTPTLTTCPVCQGKVSSAAPACPHCGQPMSGGQVAQPRPARVREPEDNTPRCPTCRSKNIRELTPLDRGLSLFAWGFASGKLGKSMICKNCGYKW